MDFHHIIWKIRKHTDIIRRKSKELKDIFELLASTGAESACAGHESKMADGADEVSLLYVDKTPGRSHSLVITGSKIKLNNMYIFFSKNIRRRRCLK